LDFRGKKKFPIPLEAEKKDFHKDLRVKKWPETRLFLLFSHKPAKDEIHR